MKTIMLLLKFFNKILVIFPLSIFLLSCSHPTEMGPTEKKGPRHFEIKIPMDDGVSLATDVYIPRWRRHVPVVLVRTPYNKNVEKWMGKAFNLFGIAVVIQDCRGKFKSEGEFYPFVNEREDGLKTLRWIREQDWSNGVIAGWGGSYVGYTQWAISDSLDLLTLLVTSANLYEFFYPDTVFSLESAFLWGFENASEGLNEIPLEKMQKSFFRLPLSTADDSTIKDIPYINDWLAHEKYDNYWECQNFREIATAPVISMAGWYDIFLKAQINDFQSLIQKGDEKSRLIIGPFAHGSFAEPNEYGGIEKTGDPKHIFKYVKNYLKGNRTRLKSPLKDARYNLFIMERNEYVGSDIWPPVETHFISYYFGPDNYLSPKKYHSVGNLEYTYSPADPYPSHGGTVLGNGVGPARQNENLARKDQLCFELPISAGPLILLGPISAKIWVSSDAPCTHFFVEVQDVFPDGKIINIQEGIAKVKFKDNNPMEKEISVWATGYQINPGHKMRVVIASSWFPRFNRSLNTCEPIYGAAEMRDANQKVFYGPEYSSSIILPVYTKEGLK